MQVYNIRLDLFSFWGVMSLLLVVFDLLQPNDLTFSRS